jgi:hypothetical protein
MGELHAQLQASKDVINLRHFAEELANCTNSNTILDDVTVFSSPPTFLGQDNKSIQSITKIEGGKGKALRRESRVINHCLSLSQKKLINPVHVETLKQLADPGSKRWVNAVKFWRMASQILGPHSSISEILSILEHSKSSYNDISEYESQIALISTITNLSNNVYCFAGNIYKNVLVFQIKGMIQLLKQMMII